MPTINPTEIRRQITEARNRVEELVAVCERENRDLTEAEQAESRSLSARIDTLALRLRAAENAEPQTRAARDVSGEVRQNMNRGAQSVFCFYRDLNMASDAAAGGVIPLRLGDILEPLEEGLVIGMLGLPMPTGLSGDHVWPMYEAAEASVLDEGVAIADSKLKWDKVSTNPQRIGIAYPITRESINQTDGIVESVVRTVMPRSLTQLINKLLLSPTKVGEKNNIVGPFVNAKRYALPAEPAYKDFNLMVAEVLESGVDGTGLCWVMTKKQKAILEGTPRDTGSGLMIVENGHLCGLPIFTSHYIGEGNIGLGDWRYQPMGLYGDINFTVDPYSLSRKNAVDFVLNANYGTVTLRPEAFLLGQVANPAAEAKGEAPKP
ncbi:MAG: phage major capsid protein [Pseudoflavonifractor sp.]|nr:phage major capsid protein [Alloprevotella sp.]MCM1117635.1 phage major capsid protein [Pseudoflavonifractor sp.]